jgi:hypothetical protein
MMINEHLSASPSQQPYQGDNDNKKSAAVTRNTLTPAKHESIDEYGQQQVKRAAVFDKPKQSVS